jgi:hypothetical protein
MVSSPDSGAAAFMAALLHLRSQLHLEYRSATAEDPQIQLRSLAFCGFNPVLPPQGHTTGPAGLPTPYRVRDQPVPGLSTDLARANEQTQTYSPPPWTEDCSERNRRIWSACREDTGSLRKLTCVFCFAEPQTRVNLVCRLLRKLPNRRASLCGHAEQMLREESVDNVVQFHHAVQAHFV